jgi:hypothetical protein
MSMATPSGRCFKVQTEAGTGWVPGDALSGTGEFDLEVRAAPLLTDAGTRPAVTAGSDVVVTATRLLHEKRPRAALQLLDESIKSGTKSGTGSYDAIVLAGVAARAADDPEAALTYFERAQTMRPDISVERLLASVRKEVAGDKSRSKLMGGRFVLRFEDGSIAAETARSILAVLDAEYSRISTELGCNTSEPIVTVVQSLQAYRASTDVAEWSGGLFDGHRIRIPLLSRAPGVEDGSMFAHEIVHACLASLGRWPAWLHEGLAQKLSGVTASAGLHHKIRSFVRQGKLPRLGNVSQSWSRMSPEHAANAYSYALVAVETLYAMYPSTVASLLRNPENIPRVTAELDRVLVQ